MGSQASSDLQKRVDADIDSTKVLIYSKTYCPFCKATKGLMKSIGVNPTYIELDVVEHGAEMQDAVAARSKQRSVPNIFIGGKHLGGNDVAQAAAKSGKLKALLDEAGVANTASA